MPPVRIENVDHTVRVIAERIHAVQMAAYAQEAQLLQARHFPPLERTVADIQASPERFLGALDGEALVGAVSVGLDEEADDLNIASLVVLPARQREGIGRRLLAAVVAEHGHTGLTVSTGAKNAPALALYAQFGFVAFRRWFVGREPLALVKLRRPGTPPGSSQQETLP